MFVCKIHVHMNYPEEQCSDGGMACTVGILKNPILPLSVLCILRG